MRQAEVYVLALRAVAEYLRECPTEEGPWDTTGHGDMSVDGVGRRLAGQFGAALARIAGELEERATGEEAGR